MKTFLMDLLICPSCLPQEKNLILQIRERNGPDIWAGSLRCPQCGTDYPIQEGVAFLLPEPREATTLSRYESPSVLSSYLWSHYGDLLKDKEATTAYTEWADLVQHHTGLSLDSGCAVGRFTFELAEKSAFAVGIDNSRLFIQKARELMIHRRLHLNLAVEGKLLKEAVLRLPEAWSTDKVEFIVGDAQILPFGSHLFSSVASLNLIDKIPTPLQHLKEINRIAKDREVQFLISDPFSWSEEVAREEDWLGGTSRGPYTGKGIDNIRALLTGKKGDLLPPWKIVQQGHVWWNIRNHSNHFEHIRSCFLKASR